MAKMTTRPTRESSESAESRRLEDDRTRQVNWKRWGPYLAERQWGTVREDYSPHGTCWDYFPHDHARSRAYRWGEDGLLGICDREARVCFALALWNGRDPILKERLFGLTGPEGNHGEDVKECYFYLDGTPTHSYLKALYKYPQAAFPYTWLVEENRRRGKGDREFELADTGVFDDGRYFDVFAEYAKAGPDDLAIRITVANRGPEAAVLHLLPTVWLRNTWSWGRSGEGYWPKGRIARAGDGVVTIDHPSLGSYRLEAETLADGEPPALLFTENETNVARLFGGSNATPYVKDAFHEYLCAGRADAVNPDATGTKAAAHYRLAVPAGGEIAVHLRLARADRSPSRSATAAAPGGAGAGSEPSAPGGRAYDLAGHCRRVLADRTAEADAFYDERLPADLTADERAATRQGYAGLLWSKQFFHFVVQHWLDGDPAQPPPPAGRVGGRNRDWRHLYNRDVVSMPDKWEYPWYAAWDLAFHMLPFARIDIEFAKQQLILFLREWYMHPNGQIPAYEFAFGDVNPPVHAWAVWRVYKMSGARGARDRLFLARAFQKLLINFTWWVNRKDAEGNNLFGGGFLGLDNVGVFDRSQPLPTGGTLEQADGTAWMASYCLTMLAMALELAEEDPSYEDVASKFFEHFIAIVDAMNTLGGSGLWDDGDGFYYDQLAVDGAHVPLRVRSIAGLIPLFACANLESEQLARLPGFRKRMEWFLENRRDLARHIAYMEEPGADQSHGHRLLALPSRERLERVLRYVLDESEFLSDYGIRSVSRVHRDRPYVFRAGGDEYRVGYVPGESDTGLFGGNSNWRGPIWFPLNYLLVEALERYHHFYGDTLKIECPTGSGRWLSLREVAHEISARLARIVLPDATGRRPCNGGDRRYDDPHWKDLVLFSEYFHGDTGRGLGASHQTGWTALVLRCIEDAAAARRAAEPTTHETVAEHAESSDAPLRATASRRS